MEIKRKTQNPIIGAFKKGKNSTIKDMSIRILVISAGIILVPCIILGIILVSASRDTGAPVLGHRFDGDLDPAITQENMNSIKSAVESLDSVESCEVVLTTAQVRINVKVTESSSKNKIETTMNSIYSIVDKTIPVNTYFKNTDLKRMYDLAINVYNQTENFNDSYIYYCLTKNGTMDSYTTQFLSEPQDEELATELREKADAEAAAEAAAAAAEAAEKEAKKNN